ncbi:hypothetical protein [Rhodohalobacter sp. 8-1]|uniref:hypothetical protein n=1 Tax=Rhodohalobacter sp. 8-1 TaxID=3131972 RepID=UPI0030EEA98B
MGKINPKILGVQSSDEFPGSAPINPTAENYNRQSRHPPRLTTLGKINLRILSVQSSDEFPATAPTNLRILSVQSSDEFQVPPINSTVERNNRQSRDPARLTTLGKIKPRPHNSQSSDEFQVPTPSTRQSKEATK